MSREEYILFETKLGACGIAWRESGGEGGLAVTAFQLPDASDRLTAKRIADKSPAVEARKTPPLIETIIGKIQEHFAGVPQDFSDIEVDLGGAGPFAKAVYSAAREISAGRTMTYGELAKAIKHPKAARAVGNALARNPVPLIIPCHRVLAAGNRPGGYSAPGGIATKTNLLAMEGTSIGVNSRPPSPEPD